jgi:hypothetical protein
MRTLLIGALWVLAGCSGLRIGNPDPGDTGPLQQPPTTTSEPTGGATTSEATCGDGVAEGDEECDRDDFLGSTCRELGFNSGEPVCTPGCLVSDVNCFNQGDCDDSCVYAQDGSCDDGGPGASVGCDLGTDCEDCGWRLCEDSCSYADDGVCDDGGAGSEGSSCTYGMDCSDCGVR